MSLQAAPLPFDPAFWGGRRVFVTGHTGFKGSWICLWLHAMGARVTGYALPPPTEPSLFALARLDGAVRSIRGDVRDAESLAAALRGADPEIVFHLAAQALVLESYRRPVETYATNVMGTVNLLEAARSCPGIRALVNVTSDKCYENREWAWGYRENDSLGGRDPYSSSKACSELVTAAYRSSFFERGPAVATARAGNVIGGGDFAADRLVPDCVRALLAGRPIRLRNPGAVRPWQHVLDPTAGYLLLARRLFDEGPRFAGAWNFGPEDTEGRPVRWIVESLCARWEGGASVEADPGPHAPEAHRLVLDASKSRMELGWRPRWTVEEAVAKAAEWYGSHRRGEDAAAACRRQIDEYEGRSPGRSAL